MFAADRQKKLCSSDRINQYIIVVLVELGSVTFLILYLAYIYEKYCMHAMVLLQK